MEKALKRTTLVLAVLTAGLWAANGGREDGLGFSLAITASVFLYHFGMRLLTGSAVHAVMHNHADYSAFWFRPRKWEAPLYRLLRVRRWKRKMPAYHPELFDFSRHSPEEVAQAMCQAEIVHEIIAVLSFLPLFAVKYAGALPVFLITSVLAAAVDLSFAVIQRYNRPRIVKILEKQKKKRQK